MTRVAGVRPSLSGRAQRLYDEIAQLVWRPTAFMEVCGTHTMAIGRFGLRSRLPAELRLISGPGCPVCVTPCEQIDQAVAMAREPGVTLLTFGDMMRVPGKDSSLAQERADGRDVRVLYSAFDALALAREEPRRLFVLFGIGFETTSPTIAATLVRAAEEGRDNLLVLPALKRIVPAMEALTRQGETRLDGYLCPGHVSVVIGSAPYEPLASRHGMPCVIAGFDALDILEALVMLLEQRIEGRVQVEVAYKRAVRPEGNRVALALLDRVFRVCDARWRGIGMIPDSGFELADAFARFDARRRVPVEVEAGPDLPEGCACGEVMRGLLTPTECPLFGRGCHPEDPTGPCMVSGEGACAAYYRYG